MRQLDTFTKTYIEAALWSSHDESDESGGEPMDANYGVEDIAEETIDKMAEDCAKFQRENEADIDGKDSQAGHDFWLTRNGHGVGFWDREEIWGVEGAARLTKACEAFGSFDLYIGDDGKVYGQ